MGREWSLGLDVGSTTLKAVVYAEGAGVLRSFVRATGGHAARALEATLR